MPECDRSQVKDGQQLLATPAASSTMEIHLREKTGIYLIEWRPGRCKVASTNAMLWLVAGVSSFGSSTSSVTPREPKEVTPPAPAPSLAMNSCWLRSFPQIASAV